MPAKDKATTESKVRVRFVTKNPDIRVIDTPIAVPLKLGRFGLSEVVNHLLDKNPPIPFDFLIADEFVRTSLEKHIKKYNISEDLVITVEYIEAIVPPKHELACEHDDWISSVAGGFSGYVITGSYDKKARIWDQTSGECVSVVEGHVGAVKAVAWVAKALGKSDTFKFITGSADRSVRCWKVSKGGAAFLRHTYLGHEESVEAIDVSLDGSMFCSASYDSSVRLWPIKPTNTGVDGAAHSKKRKLEKAPVEVKDASKTLFGHAGAVTCVKWPTTHQIVSGSFDKTVRIWDVESGLPEIITTPTVVYSVSYTPIAGIIATSHADKVVRIWDPRVPDGKTLTHSFASHTAWASGIVILLFCVADIAQGVAWHPRTPYPQFASCSHDGNVKVWDLRSPTPLFTLPSHTDRALCVDWAGVNVNTNTAEENNSGNTRFDVVSGGADNKLRVWKCD